jgi:hypothetical protein
MKAILQCLIFGGLVALAACGKDSGGGGAAAVAPTAVVTPNGCPADQVPTQAGCGVCNMQMCGQGMGQVGQTCYPVIANTAVNTPNTYGTPYGNPSYPNQYPNQFGSTAVCSVGYNNGLNTGYNGNYPGNYQAGYYQSGGSVMYYNSQTQSFSNYYSQAPYGNPYGYGYGYRPYRSNGGYISGAVTFSF